MEQPEREADGSSAAADEERSPTPPPLPSPAISAATLGCVLASPASHSPAQLPPPKQPAPAVDDPMEKSEREEEETGSTAAAGEALSPSPPPPPSPALSDATSASIHDSPTSRSSAQLPPPKKGELLAVITSDDTKKLERAAMDSTGVGAGPRSPTPPPSPDQRSTPGFLHTAPAPSPAAPSRPPEQYPPSAAPLLAAMEKAKWEAPGSSSSTDGDAPTAPASPSSFLHAMGAFAASGTLAESSSRAADRARLQEQLAASGHHAVSASHAAFSARVAHEGDDIVDPPFPNGGLMDSGAVSVVAGNLNGDKADAPLCCLEQFVVENKCLKQMVNELTAEKEKAESEQKQREDSLKQREDNLKQREDAVLLDRLLHRERKVKDAETAARVQWFTQTRHRQGDNTDGISGAPACADLAMLQLIYPLLQPTQQSASTPNPDNAHAPSASPIVAPKAEDEMWNKRQIGYVFYLGIAMGLLFLIRPFLPREVDRILLAVFAGVWGLGTIGFPLGIFGTSRFEKECSRHIGRFIALCFSLMVIYAAYLLALSPLDAAGTSPSPSPPPLPNVDHKVTVWRIVFGTIGGIVSVLHTACWIMSCHTGGDKDLLP